MTASGERLLLAVDGGNSKTDVLLVDTAGTVLGHARGEGSNHQTAGGMEPAIRRLDELIRRAVGGVGAPVLAYLCLAGADLPVELAALEQAASAAGWADKATVDNDTMALLRAGADAPDAVAVVCGAGINCVARAADGRTVRFPSLGRVSGDWGGGRDLGELALWHAARGEDGRGPATALAAAVAEHFGCTGVAEVSAAVHLRQIPPRRLDELTPLLFRVADEGDAVARAVVMRQAEEVAALVTAALRRLDLLRAPATVVLGGGVLRARHALLEAEVRRRVRAVVPRAEFTVVTQPPVLGAALLGLDALGADPGAHDALRAAVRGIGAQVTTRSDATL